MVWTDGANGVCCFLPTNANPDKLLRTGVVFSDIKNPLASIAGKALFFVDTCHPGNIMGARRGVADINVVVNELASAETAQWSLPPRLAGNIRWKLTPGETGYLIRRWWKAWAARQTIRARARSASTCWICISPSE